MKRLLVGLLALFSSALFAADAIFTWTKPNPKFTSTVPLNWTIDEYRIYCTVTPNPAVPSDTQSYTITVLGYDTESHAGTDLIAGETSCYIKSYSIGSNSESVPSATATAFLHDGGFPNVPGSFDFSVPSGVGWSP